jgi:LysR family transcriptional regulator for bpeEF and oprC
MQHHMQAMKAFVRVVEAGTFTRAAESLRIPKPTVTKLVQELERHLRVKLLNRTTRRVSVTPDGSAYYERVTRLLGDLDDIESSVSHAQKNPLGRLRVDCGAAVASMILLPALPKFFAQYPDIRVELGVSDRPADLIGENIDCVIRGGPLRDSGLVARHIGDLPFMTCATRDYLDRHGTPTHPTDLERGHVIAGYFFAGSGRVRPLEFLRDAHRMDIAPNPRIAVNESTAHLISLRSGIGIGQVLAFMVTHTNARNELVPVLEEWQPPPLPVHLLYPANRHLSTKLRVFVDWVAELFAMSNCTRRR